MVLDPKFSDFGWQLLHKTIENKINKKSDILIAFIHLQLGNTAGFRCIGMANSITNHINEVGTDLLPEEWNASDLYQLQYICKDIQYLLLATSRPSSMITNLLNRSTNKVSVIALDPNEIVQDLHGEGLKNMIADLESLNLRLHEELFEPVVPSFTNQPQTGVNKETQTDIGGVNNPHPYDFDLSDRAFNESLRFLNMNYRSRYDFSESPRIDSRLHIAAWNPLLSNNKRKRIQMYD